MRVQCFKNQDHLLAEGCALSPSAIAQMPIELALTKTSQSGACAFVRWMRGLGLSRSTVSRVHGAAQALPIARGGQAVLAGHFVSVKHGNVSTGMGLHTGNPAQRLTVSGLTYLRVIGLLPWGHEAAERLFTD
jgi:hypothetical protein